MVDRWTSSPSSRPPLPWFSSHRGRRSHSQTTIRWRRRRNARGRCVGGRPWVPTGPSVAVSQVRLTRSRSFSSRTSGAPLKLSVFSFCQQRSENNFKFCMSYRVFRKRKKKKKLNSENKKSVGSSGPTKRNGGIGRGHGDR